MDQVKIHTGNCLDILPTMEAGSVNCCVTSPPYFGLRAYLPDAVVLKDDAPEWVKKELKSLSIFPVDHT